MYYCTSMYYEFIFQIPPEETQVAMHFRKFTSEIKPLMMCNLQNGECFQNAKPTKQIPIAYSKETQFHECYWLGEPCGSKYSKIYDKKEDEYFCSESNLQNCVMVGFFENVSLQNSSPSR